MYFCSIHIRKGLPSKHETFTKCCFNVGPPSFTLAQYWNNNVWMSLVCYWGIKIDTSKGCTVFLTSKLTSSNSYFTSEQIPGYHGYLLCTAHKPIYVIVLSTLKKCLLLNIVFGQIDEYAGTNYWFVPQLVQSWSTKHKLKKIKQLLPFCFAQQCRRYRWLSRGMNTRGDHAVLCFTCFSDHKITMILGGRRANFIC